MRYWNRLLLQESFISDKRSDFVFLLLELIIACYCYQNHIELLVSVGDFGPKIEIVD